MRFSLDQYFETIKRNIPPISALLSHGPSQKQPYSYRITTKYTHQGQLQNDQNHIEDLPRPSNACGSDAMKNVWPNIFSVWETAIKIDHAKKGIRVSY